MQQHFPAIGTSRYVSFFLTVRSFNFLKCSYPGKIKAAPNKYGNSSLLKRKPHSWKNRYDSGYHFFGCWIPHKNCLLGLTLNMQLQWFLFASVAQEWFLYCKASMKICLTVLTKICVYHLPAMLFVNAEDVHSTVHYLCVDASGWYHLQYIYLHMFVLFSAICCAKYPSSLSVIITALFSGHFNKFLHYFNLLNKH